MQLLSVAIAKYIIPPGSYHVVSYRDETDPVSVALQQALRKLEDRLLHLATMETVETQQRNIHWDCLGRVQPMTSAFAHRSVL